MEQQLPGQREAAAITTRRATAGWWEDGHPGWMIFTLGGRHFDNLDDIIQVWEEQLKMHPSLLRQAAWDWRKPSWHSLGAHLYMGLLWQMCLLCRMRTCCTQTSESCPHNCIILLSRGSEVTHFVRVLAQYSGGGADGHRRMPGGGPASGRGDAASPSLGGGHHLPTGSHLTGPPGDRQQRMVSSTDPFALCAQ